MEDIIKELLHLQHGFPEVYHLIKVAMTIPVTSASAERYFSVLKRIKTYLRATMGQERPILQYYQLKGNCPTVLI